MMSEAVLLGLSPQGLSVLRMLSRRQWRIHVFSDTAHCAGYYSKYGEKHLFADIHDLKQQLQKIAAAWSLQHPDQKMRCIIANGVILASILRDYPEIYQDFLVEPSPLEWYGKCVIKIRCTVTASAKVLLVQNFRY